MRTNKFIPILLAVAIHLLPVSYFLLKPQAAPPQNPGPSFGNNKLPEGIDLSGFSLQRQPQRQGPKGEAKASQNSIKSVGQNSGNSGSSGDSSGEAAGTGGSGGGSDEMIFLKFHQPVYPVVAREKGYEGVVKAKINYNHDGDIEKVEIIESSGYKMLDEAVKKTASEWKLSVKNSGNFEKSFEFKLKN